ncbi:MAG TPA: TlpA disulfide reductase family protein [Acidiferrobacterales bacterium]
MPRLHSSGWAFALALLAVSLAAPAADGPQTLTGVNFMAKDFTLNDADGRPHRLAELRGKVVLVNFWATWCPPCRREMPSMQRAYDMLKSKDFAMLAVNVGEDVETIFGFSFATGVELTFPILLDRDSAVTNAWPVRALPTSFLIDRDGRAVFRAVGGRDWDDPKLIGAIRELVGAQDR